MEDESENAVEKAISQRLAKLRGMPVDTTRLDGALRAAIPSPPSAAWRRAMRPLLAVAASLLLIATLILALTPAREVQASAGEMAQMHRDIVSGKLATMRVDSIDEANRAIAAMAGDGPKLPQAPAAHTMACCMKSISNRKVACVLLNDGTTPITMSVADAADMRSPESPVVMRGGVTYHVQTMGDLTMVMTERDKRWVCLIGAVSDEKLISIAEALKF